MSECEIACEPTDHAVDGAKEHGALGGGGALPEVLQYQRAVAEDINKLAKVKNPHLLQVLPLLVCGGRAAGHEQNKKTGLETEKTEQDKVFR